VDEAPAGSRTADASAAPDEAALVARAQADRHAFAPLYARYLDPVYRYCYRRLGSKEAAEDARWLQEVEDRADRAAVAEARAEVAEHGTIPWEQVKAELAELDR
jgi:hypothetical protein